MTSQLKRFVLSPCGTSLLTNHANDKAERSLIGKYANTKEPGDILPEDLKQLQLIVDRAKQNLATADLETAKKMSAELNGIINLYEGQLAGKQDYHTLLSTDTWLGETTANLVAEWLNQQGLITEVKREKDLQTKNIEQFQDALSEIVSWCQATVPGYRSSGYKVIFNLTGGFKSVQGFLQTLATFYADESIYIFESSTDLLKIPRLPVQMDAEKTVQENLTAFRRLAIDLPVTDISGIPETLLTKVGDLVDLSPWGKLVWVETKAKIYGQGFWGSPSERIKFGARFEQSLKDHKLDADRLIHINDRLDNLARYLETKDEQQEKYNLASLDFKPLRNDPYPPSTHEIDAWADQDAKRMFGHYEGDIFVLDKLDRALH